jgi:hypothetical protein
VQVKSAAAKEAEETRLKQEEDDKMIKEESKTKPLILCK